MGYWKEVWLEEMSRIYTPPKDRFVCRDCVSDSHLKTLIDKTVEEERCSYCRADGAADISVVLDAITQAIGADYNDPAEELPYESREGGYQGTVYDGSELVYELGDWTQSDELLEDAAGAFGGTAWCDRDYFGVDDFEALKYGWDGFSNQVKHRTRFLFLQELGRDGADPRSIPPGRMLDALGDLFREFDLFRDVGVGTPIIRARVVEPGARPSSASELGTAPRTAVVSPNRMSPAGIPMFYGACSESTAVLETYDPHLDFDREIALAKFLTLRPMVFLDLTTLPPMPSPFDPENRASRKPIAFLRSFARDLSRPVARDRKAHTEYVPTQVVTEYVRHRLTTTDDQSIDGIIYRSSKLPEETALVAFADPEECGPRDEPKRFDPEPILELSDVRYAAVQEFEHLWKAR